MLTTSIHGKITSGMGEVHTVQRGNIYDDVVSLYEDVNVVSEYPIYIEFQLERAVGCGLRWSTEGNVLCILGERLPAVI